jgi:ATP-dependent HslUV protease subunit HslV
VWWGSYEIYLTLILAAAARALMDIPDLSAEEVAKKAMTIASSMCVYTNDNFLVETIETKKKEEEN